VDKKDHDTAIGSCRVGQAISALLTLTLRAYLMTAQSWRGTRRSQDAIARDFIPSVIMENALKRRGRSGARRGQCRQRMQCCLQVEMWLVSRLIMNGSLIPCCGRQYLHPRAEQTQLIQLIQLRLTRNSCLWMASQPRRGGSASTCAMSDDSAIELPCQGSI
jgi:hypothetical protein